jgi:opacity protein-like surface antigen
MFKTTTAIATVAAFAAMPALAGNVSEPTSEPVIAAPAPIAPSTPNWTGFYTGGQLGWAWVDTDIAGDRGHAANVEGGRGERGQDGDGVIDAGIGVDDDRPGRTVAHALSVSTAAKAARMRTQERMPL